MLKFHITEPARDDLDALWEYIASDNVTAANKVEDDILKALYNLADNPHMGHIRPDLCDKDLRFWSVYSYLIIYDANTSPISVLRILSGYRDIEAIL